MVLDLQSVLKEKNRHVDSVFIQAKNVLVGLHDMAIFTDIDGMRARRYVFWT